MALIYDIWNKMSSAINQLLKPNGLWFNTLIHFNGGNSLTDVVNVILNSKHKFRNFYNLYNLAYGNEGRLS